MARTLLAPLLVLAALLACSVSETEVPETGRSEIGGVDEYGEVPATDCSSVAGRYRGGVTVRDHAVIGGHSVYSEGFIPIDYVVDVYGDCRTVEYQGSPLLRDGSNLVGALWTDPAEPAPFYTFRVQGADGPPHMVGARTSYYFYVDERKLSIAETKTSEAIAILSYVGRGPSGG